MFILSFKWAKDIIIISSIIIFAVIFFSPYKLQAYPGTHQDIADKNFIITTRIFNEKNLTENNFIIYKNAEFKEQEWNLLVLLYEKDFYKENREKVQWKMLFGF